jgi:bifunctional DNA-binding transcriptional regulator/antitoxin component of YhaV-PrlF toxin-antitoxin module
MAKKLASKGQVTIPKRARDQRQGLPGSPMAFSANAAGEAPLNRVRETTSAPAPGQDRFDTVRGSADVRWPGDGLTKLLRPDD